MEELRTALEQMTKEDLVRFIIIVADELNLSVSIVNDILGDMS